VLGLNASYSGACVLSHSTLRLGALAKQRRLARSGFLEGFARRLNDARTIEDGDENAEPCVESKGSERPNGLIQRQEGECDRSRAQPVEEDRHGDNLRAHVKWKHL